MIQRTIIDWLRGRAAATPAEVRAAHPQYTPAQVGAALLRLRVEQKVQALGNQRTRQWRVR